LLAIGFEKAEDIFGGPFTVMTADDYQPAHYGCPKAKNKRTLIRLGQRQAETPGSTASDFCDGTTFFRKPSRIP